MSRSISLSIVLFKIMFVKILVKSLAHTFVYIYNSITIGELLFIAGIVMVCIIINWLYRHMQSLPNPVNCTNVILSYKEVAISVIDVKSYLRYYYCLCVQWSYYFFLYVFSIKLVQFDFYLGIPYLWSQFPRNFLHPKLFSKL